MYLQSVICLYDYWENISILNVLSIDTKMRMNVKKPEFAAIMLNVLTLSDHTNAIALTVTVVTGVVAKVIIFFH